MAAWFGFLTGIAELVNVVFAQQVLHQRWLIGYDTLAWSPWSNAVVFLVVALVLLPLNFLGPGRRVLPGLALGIFGGGLALSILLAHPAIHRLASLALALGIGIQMARLGIRHLAICKRFAVRSLPVLLIAAVALPLCLSLQPRRAAERQLAAAGDPESPVPNILLIVWDTVRAESVTGHGYRRPTTPHLAKLAEEGVQFSLAMSTAPWTLPSHASMFTGRWSHELSTSWKRPLDDEFPTIAEQLRARHYRTAGFVANQTYCHRNFGLDRGFTHYDDRSPWPYEFALSCQAGRTLLGSRRIWAWLGWKDYWGRKSAEEVNQEFLQWLDRSDRYPFFAFLNYFDAHDPYLPPSPWNEAQLGRGEWLDRPRAAQFGPVPPRAAETRNRLEMSESEVEAELLAYEQTIAYLDEQLGVLLSEMRRRGMLDGTVVIVTSDHGEHFGEHGHQRHGSSLFSQAVHVPLVIYGPNWIPEGRRVSSPVSLRSLPSTIMNLVDKSAEEVFPGLPLTRYWRNPLAASSPPELLLSVEATPDYEPTRQAIYGLVDGDFKYVLYLDGHSELYHLRQDPRDSVNLARDPQYAEVLAVFRGRAEAHFQQYLPWPMDESPYLAQPSQIQSPPEIPESPEQASECPQP